MKAVAYQTPGPIERDNALLDVDLPDPSPEGRDLLVEIRAVAVNPLDVKLRARSAPKPGEWRVPGHDAAGIVRATGPEATLFRPGDEVFYAGTIARPGASSELHLVDERIAGRKPASLAFSKSAALPSGAITSWEMIFDRLDVRRPVPGAAPAVLVIGGGGGVGSMAIQLLRALTDLTVIATASRPETRDWAQALGAHHVLDHRQPLAPQVKALGLGAPGFVFSISNTAAHLHDIFRLIAAQGRFGLIDDAKPLDVAPFRDKAVSIHWEGMFVRSLHRTPDLAEQGALLNETAQLADEGRIRTTMTKRFDRIDAANMKQAHALMERGGTPGKIVLEGF